MTTSSRVLEIFFHINPVSWINSLSDCFFSVLKVFALFPSVTHSFKKCFSLDSAYLVHLMESFAGLVSVNNKMTTFEDHTYSLLPVFGYKIEVSCYLQNV